MLYQVWSEFSGAFLFGPSPLDIAIGHAEIMARECSHNLVYRVHDDSGAIVYRTSLAGRQLPIVKSPIGFQYMLDLKCECAYTFFGTPYAMTDFYRSLPVIGYVTCLFAWQRGEMTPAQENN